MDSTQTMIGRTWKERLEVKGSDFWQWMRHDVDWAFVGAAAVEIPRYTAAFMAIHEPWYIGVPLAALLAWSTKSAWEYVFERGWRRAWGVSILNVIALTVAVVIITPVIYLMMSMPIDQIDMTKFNLWTADPVQLAWAFAMSLCTFLPLMLVAAVKAGKNKEALARSVEPSVVAVTHKVASVIDPVAEPAMVQVMEKARVDSRKNGMSGGVDPRKLDAWQMAQSDFTHNQIAGKFSVTDRTVRNWIKEVEELKGEQA